MMVRPTYSEIEKRLSQSNQTSKECITKTGIPATIHVATLAIGSSASDRCASSLSMNCSYPSGVNPKESTSSFTLGGRIIVEDAVYGLTIGHAFLPPDSCHADTTSGECSQTQPTTTEDVEESEYVIVSAEDGKIPTDSPSASITGDFQLMSISNDDSSKPRKSRRGLKARHDARSYPVEVLTPMTNKPDIRTPTSHRHNCDWGLMQLPRASPISSNTYYPEFGIDKIILGSHLDTTGRLGEVKVILPNDRSICGHLRANGASYQIGQYDLDVRMVYLDEDLRKCIIYTSTRYSPNCYSNWLFRIMGPSGGLCLWLRGCRRTGLRQISLHCTNSCCVRGHSGNTWGGRSHNTQPIPFLSSRSTASQTWSSVRSRAQASSL